MRVGITSFIIVLFYLAVNMKPVTKLNLGINPMACDVGSLMFAKNMKVDKDDCLVNDYGYEDIEALKDYNIIGHIVGLDDKIYLFTDEATLIKTGTEDIYTKFENEAGNLYKHVLETTTHYIDYINSKGWDTIYRHTEEMIESRLAPKFIGNDGKQTPMKGHPVFVAQHATATCCRGCLNKWHHIPKHKDLNAWEIHYVTSVIMEYILKQYIEKQIKCS